MDGYLVCGKCSRMNGFCTLIKPNVPEFVKASNNALWIEFDENSKGLERLFRIRQWKLLKPFLKNV